MAVLKSQGLTNFLVIAGIIFLCWFSNCRNSGQNQSSNDTITQIITQYDSTVKIIEQPVYHFVTKVQEVQVPAKVDTSAIIKDYFTKYTANYTFRDSSIEAEVTDTIFKNSSVGMSFSYKNLRPTQIITNNVITQEKLRNKLYIGASLSYRDNLSPGGLLTFQNKREQLLTAGYSIDKIYFIGFQTKISFRK